jgi:hypothetical protein
LEKSALVFANLYGSDTTKTWCPVPHAQNVDPSIAFHTTFAWPVLTIDYSGLEMLNEEIN